MFAFEFQFFRQSVKDNVKIELTDNANVKSGQRSSPKEDSIKYHDVRQILGFVGVEIFLYPSKKAQELRGGDKGSQHCQLWPIKAKL